LFVTLSKLIVFSRFDYANAKSLVLPSAVNEA